MKISKKLFISSLLALAFCLFVGKAQAATLSQTSVSLSVGQTSTVYASNVLTSIYLTSNSNPNIASVSVVGDNINIYGSALGNTVATICDNTTICNTIYITVTGTGYSSGSLSLSQTSLSLSVGQTSVVTAYNTYGTSTALYISNNSNSSVVTATIVGNTVSVYGNNTGSSTLTICQSYNVSCVSLYVTVGGYGYNGYGYNGTNTVGLNISSLTLATGDSATVSSSNSGLGLYVSSNSNPNIVSTGASSSVIPGCIAGALYSVTTGQPCNGYGNYGIGSSSYYIPGCYAGALYSITSGQLCSSYNGANVGNNNGSVIFSAISPGSDTITLCQSGGISACSTIYITVTGRGIAIPLGSSYSSTNNSGIPTVYSTSQAN